MSAGSGAGFGGEADAVEDGEQADNGGAEQSDVEVSQLGDGGSVSASVGDHAEGDGTDGYSRAERELHEGGEEAVGAGHALGRDLGEGQGGHAGELKRAGGSVGEEDSGYEEAGGIGAEGCTERDGDRCDDSVDDEDTAEAEAAEDLDHEGLHAEVAGEEGEEVKAGGEGVEAEGLLEHEREEEGQDGDGDAEAAASVGREREGFEAHRLKIDEGVGDAVGGDESQDAAEDAEGEDGGGEGPGGVLAA